MKTKNDIKRNDSSTSEFILVLIHITVLVITFVGPFAVLGYQVLHWAKHGVWLSLPISVTGFDSWQGLASLPLSLGILVVGLLLSMLIETFYPGDNK